MHAPVITRRGWSIVGLKIVHGTPAYSLVGTADPSEPHTMAAALLGAPAASTERQMQHMLGRCEPPLQCAYAHLNGVPHTGCCSTTTVPCSTGQVGDLGVVPYADYLLYFGGAVVFHTNAANKHRCP